jgi:predicted DNA-binding transcriptional regulator YafY
VLINQGDEAVTASLVAAEFEVARRTIKRDIEFMRDRLGVPIRWHAKWRTYYYTRPCPQLPLFRLTEKDIALLAMANQRFAAWAGVSMAAMLRVVLKKFASAAGSAVPLPDLSPDGDGAPITEFAAREQEYIAAVWEAMAKRRELRVQYRKARSTVIETRTIHPLHVDCPGRRWIVIVRDLERSDYRTFRLGRIHGLELTGRKFTVPTDFNAAEILRGNVGAYTGKEDHEVRFLARDNAAIYAEEEGFHRSQKLIHREDGRVEVILRVNNLVEIKYELLRWGPEIEVLSPQPLREAVCDAHKAALAQYGAA